MKNKETVKPVTVKEAVRAQAAVAEHSAQLRKLGAVVIQKTIEAGSAYLDLCMYIRSQKLPSRLVTFELVDIGFHKARVSEIVKVAHASDEHFSQFMARTIGFRKTLQLERSTVQTLLAKEDGVQVVDIEAEVEEVETLSEPAEKSQSDKEEQQARAVEAAARKILVWGAAENIRSKKWNMANGWELSLVRGKVRKVKQAAQALKEEKSKAAKDKEPKSAGDFAKLAREMMRPEHQAEADAKAAMKSE